MSTATKSTTPSLRPALVVCGLAVLIVVLGAIVALVPSSSPPASSTGRGARTLPGTPLTALPAAPLLAKIASGGEPPADVTGSLSIPSGSRYVTKSDGDAGVDQFDRAVTFSAPDSPAAVQRFYAEVLRAGHWQIQSDGPVASNVELLGQRAGSDGYEWGVGVVISKVQPALSPALAGNSPGSPTSKVVLTLYQVPDSS